MIRIVDLFAGIGGIRLGLEQALDGLGVEHECVFTSEIKEHAVDVYRMNFPDSTIHGDITRIGVDDIPDFDILCAGFPCQTFSHAGRKDGFLDTRGTMFFEVERILRANKPKGFILENVEGLVTHDKGNTLKTILNVLEAVGYKVSYRVLDASEFGVPQSRKRIYIVGSTEYEPDLGDFEIKKSCVGDVIEYGQKTSQTSFVKSLLHNFKISELYGKHICDKRGGVNNIHSWDIGVKGECTDEQKKFMNQLLLQRRKRIFADEVGIVWSDGNGMALTEAQISTFWKSEDLHGMLTSLVEMGYLAYEYPKQLIRTESGTSRREYDMSKEKGYNIVSGCLSFECNHILDPKKCANTLVATDMSHIYVADGDGIRPITPKEGLLMCGYPRNYMFDVSPKLGYDLVGNTVCVPVIKEISYRLLKTFNN